MRLVRRLYIVHCAFIFFTNDESMLNIIYFSSYKFNLVS